MQVLKLLTITYINPVILILLNFKNIKAYHSKNLPVKPLILYTLIIHGKQVYGAAPLREIIYFSVNQFYKKNSQNKSQ